MILNLALNHSVQSEGTNPIDKDQAFDLANISYNASSPDELALVNGARFLQITYVGRDPVDNNIFNISYKGEIRSFELLNTIEFTSTRKRMTNVFKDPSTGEIIVMCKGADSIILPLLNANQSNELIDCTNKFMDDCAKTGLRTLLFAEKILTEAEYEKWLVEYQNAANSMVERDDRIAEAAAKLEFDFNLVGSTALEDRLQDEVPETIEHIRRAGIKLWVLTGDKIETAINIGYSCRLLDDGIN